jgi:nucleotide-binding universal stress UspA family protein
LLASDGSRCALKAAEAATEIARRFHAHLIILSVYHPIPLISATGDGAFEIEPEQIENILDHALDKTATIPDAAKVEYEFRKEVGYPAEEITKAANETHCDLIVLGSRGMSGFKSLLLGSVSDRVMHSAHCPVLVVR